MGTVCPDVICLSMLYKQVHYVTQFPQDLLAIHFPVILLNHFLQPMTLHRHISLCRRAGASSSYLVPATGLPPTSLNPWDLMSQALASFV